MTGNMFVICDYFTAAPAAFESFVSTFRTQDVLFAAVVTSISRKLQGSLEVPAAVVTFDCSFD